MRDKTPRKPELDDISFDIITDIYPTKHGKRLAKRKAVFVYTLLKHFKVEVK